MKSVLVVGIFISVRARMNVWVLSGWVLWIFIAFFFSLDELVQSSALFWPYLPLGPTSLLLVETILSIGTGVSVWVLNGFLSGLRFLTWGGRYLSREVFPGVRLILAVATP